MASMVGREIRSEPHARLRQPWMDIDTEADFFKAAKQISEVQPQNRQDEAKSTMRRECEKGGQLKSFPNCSLNQIKQVQTNSLYWAFPTSLFFCSCNAIHQVRHFQDLVFYRSL